MTDEKGPLDQALDLFVYAPFGFALAARDELPKLVEKGRATLDPQLTMARMIGQFALTQGQKEAEKAVKQAVDMLGDVLGRPTPPPLPADEPAAGPAPAPAPAPRAPKAAKAATNGSGPSAEHLAIPGYDALAASQVVQRLAGLSVEELEAVRAYEEATRHRKTILTRVAQLQAEAAER
ncbi:MAG TPA: hypothetical protein VM938_11980 [Acidimicrobiales bacterium]|nr:hypothetical protein [Acidimicrobiales bacterium]